MSRPASLSAALAALEKRWGATAPAVVGSLAVLPDAAAGEPDRPAPPGADRERVVSTGFPALDAILGPGGLPRAAALALRGSGSAGTTTLALRIVAQRQADGGIAAWVDLGHSLDPVEAVARGVDLDWLVALVPHDLDEGLAMAGALLAGHAVDALVIDLPGPGASSRSRPRELADRLGRLAALARRAGVLLLVVEPAGAPDGLREAVAETAGLRLELSRRAWIRLGHDVVGQRTEVVVARNRYGPPGRRAELRILYADGGPRDDCLARADLLAEQLPGERLVPAPAPFPIPLRTPTDASPPSPLVSPPAPAGPIPLHRLSERPRRARRPALVGGDGPRRQPGRVRPRRPARHGARDRAPARARGDLPRPRA